MRVAVYDKNPGVGISQWGLKVSWMIGCFLHKLFGKLDDYYGAESWDDAFKWLETRPGTLKSIQYWGHGSAGTVWLAQMRVDQAQFKRLVPKVTPDTVLWFRTCSTIQGKPGYDFTNYLCTLLNCTVAGHTRIIGFFQGGLHTRKPNQIPTWPVTDGEWPPSLMATLGLKWGNNAIICIRATIPEGW